DRSLQPRKKETMNQENIFIKGNPDYVSRDDFAELLKNHLNTNLYRQILLENQENNNPDITFSTNENFWSTALNGDCYPEQVVKLERFHLLEWIPIAPGLFHTEDAHWNRAEAQRNAIRILRNKATGPHFLSSLIPRGKFEFDPKIKKLFEELNANPKKRVVIEYNPDGKESMIKGGMGSLRLASKMINGKECYLLGASSTGVSHEGLPILIETVLYQKAISKIKEHGGFKVNLIGRVKVIPKELSVIKSYNEIPRYCLFVEEIEYIKPSKRNDLMSSVAVAYYPSDRFSDKRLSFCSFIPDKKDKELKGAVDWLNRYAVKYSKSTSPIVEGDFDEFKAHFGKVDFPIVDIANGKMSKETFLRYKEYFHLSVNELVMGDKFENISNSNIINRSENSSINSKPDKETDRKLSKEESELKKKFQNLVAEGQIEKALEELLEEFKKRDDKYALNEAIMYNAQYSQLKTQQNFNTISHEDASKENARITKAIIDFIQRVL
ncbi:MAG: hypothetical protein AAFO82_12720, partial [Bacteroidota bacterium]